MMVVDSLILYVGVQSGSDCASATAVAVTATNVSLSMASSRAAQSSKFHLRIRDWGCC